MDMLLIHILNYYYNLYSAYNWGLNKDWSNFDVTEAKIPYGNALKNFLKNNENTPLSDQFYLDAKIYKQKIDLKKSILKLTLKLSFFLSHNNILHLFIFK